MQSFAFKILKVDLDSVDRRHFEVKVDFVVFFLFVNYLTFPCGFVTTTTSVKDCAFSLSHLFIKFYRCRFYLILRNRAIKLNKIRCFSAILICFFFLFFFLFLFIKLLYKLFLSFVFLWLKHIFCFCRNGLIQYKLSLKAK